MRCDAIGPVILIGFAVAALGSGHGASARVRRVLPQAPVSRPGLAPGILAGITLPQQAPAGTYDLAQSWTAVSAPHNAGERVADPDARSGSAWQATSGRDEPRTDLVYGPYLDLPAGDYVAFYRLKLLDQPDGDVVAALDATSDHGQSILASRDVMDRELLRGGYVEAPLAFHDPGGSLECRLMWTGYSTLRLDRIDLYRVTGADLSQTVRLAPAAVLSGRPTGLQPVSLPGSYGDIFPRSAPPAKRLLVVDITHMPADQQILAVCLEGLINRRRPQVYVLFNAIDSTWLAWMRREGWVQSAQPVTLQELMLRYRTVCRGGIITDPALPATVNVATMLAGLDDALVASPRIARGLKLPVAMDLRGRWTTSVAAYRWAFDHLWPRLSHRVLACSYPDHIALRDYLVENRVFTFWISGRVDGAKQGANPTAEARLMEQLFARMPVNIPILSYPWAGPDVGIGEGPGVGLFAQFAKYLVGSIECSNLSVHSGVRGITFRQRPASPIRLQRNRVYYSFVISDGDNLPVLTNGNYPQLWKDPLRGRFPVGWTISPSASMLIPDIADYYYATESPDDQFLGAVSGIGYTYPDQYASRYKHPSQVFAGFLRQTSRYAATMDLRDQWIMGASKRSIIRSYAQQIPSLQAIFPDYGRTVSDYDHATTSTARNVPVFHAVTGWDLSLSREKQVDELVAQVRDVTPPSRPAFLHVFVLNWGASLPMLQQIRQRLGPDYVDVRPDQLAWLYRQEMARERVVLRAPPAIIALKGRSLVAPVSVRNVTGIPMRVVVQAASGLHAPWRRSLRLPPATSVDIPIAARLTGGPIRIVVRGPFGSRSATVRVAPASATSGVPAGSLAFVDHLTAVGLAHRYGESARDPAALSGESWQATPGKDPAGFLMYGPYASYPAGDYVALFRLERTGDGDGPLATLDVCVGGGSPVLGSLDLAADQLPVGRYTVVALPFHHAAGPLETRVQWTGAAPLRLDCVDLWRVASAWNR